MSNILDAGVLEPPGVPAPGPGNAVARGTAALLVGVLLAALAGCEPPEEAGPAPEQVEARAEDELRAVLDQNLAQIATVADSLDEILRPVAFLTPGEEAGLRRYLNAQHLQRARALGVRPADRAEVDSLLASGRLVQLADTTPYWVVRRSARSGAAVVPALEVLLTRIGERFHARLETMGLPPWRLEISSVLRTAEQQAALRRSNPNAAAGVSTHEYGTTVDVIYSAYAAPAEPMTAFDIGEASWLEPRLAWMGQAMSERVAGRRSGELKAILGRVLREMQDEGLVMVTLERQQPVYHMTVARELTGS